MSWKYDSTREENFEYQNAWIRPDGRFYGVEHGEHELVINNHFDLEIIDVEKQGWARLTEEQGFTFCEKDYTPSQITKICNFYTHIGAMYALKLFLEDIEEQDKRNHL
jgi:hypothetical protein